VVTLERTEHGRTSRATITRDTIGWHYQEVREGEVVREMTYHDWHRVERAMKVFKLNTPDDSHSTKR
jgi:hypothetical protein